MGVFVPAGLLVLAWVLAAFGVEAPAGASSDDFPESAIRWMLYLPVGWMFLASGVMHTVFAKSTAKNIGWETNGFQYEVGFVSIGIGIAGILSPGMDTDAWIVLSIVTSVFLLGAAANHIVEIARDKNLAPGNTVILVYDIGLPASLWGLLFATDVV